MSLVTHGTRLIHAFLVFTSDIVLVYGKLGGPNVRYKCSATFSHTRLSATNILGWTCSGRANPRKCLT